MSDAYLQSIHEFAEVAEQFCRIIEQCEELGLDDFLFELDGALPLVYRKAHGLIANAPEDVFEIETLTTEEIDFQELIEGAEVENDEEPWKSRLEELLGPEDTHHVGVAAVADSESGLPPETDVVWHSTSAELSEMYETIRDTLGVYRQPDVENAGGDWIFGFYKWGEYVPHLLGETFRLSHATISEEESNVDL